MTAARGVGGRESISLPWPPADPRALAGFPRRRLDAGTALWRVGRKGRGPWWFGSSLAGRFDLPAPRGTCYLALDPLAAVLEVIGPGRTGGAVSEAFLEERRIRELPLPRTASLADLAARAAARFGVTLEVGTAVPYDRPQAWAARLDQAGAGGVVYLVRHDPSGAEGVALFGGAGERRGWRRGRERRIAGALVRRLERECGIAVLPIPRLAQLRVAH